MVWGCWGDVTEKKTKARLEKGSAWVIRKRRENNWVGVGKEKGMADSKAALEESAKNVEEEVRRVVEQAKELQDSVASSISKASSDELSLRHRALSLDSSIRRLQSLLRSLLSYHLLDPKLVNKAILSISLTPLRVSLFNWKGFDLDWSPISRFLFFNLWSGWNFILLFPFMISSKKN